MQSHRQRSAGTEGCVHGKEYSRTSRDLNYLESSQFFEWCDLIVVYLKSKLYIDEFSSDFLRPFQRTIRSSSYSQYFSLVDILRGSAVPRMTGQLGHNNS
jgi:hypothetical protein